MRKTKMTGKYWQDTPERHDYFEDQFFGLVSNAARRNGLSVREFLESIVNFNSFKDALASAFAEDASLGSFLGSMSNSDKREFFERQNIQELVRRNLEEETLKTIIKELPKDVVQFQGESRRFFNASTKGRRTRAYEDEIVIKSKKRTVLRDARGRFAKRT